MPTVAARPDLPPATREARTKRRAIGRILRERLYRPAYQPIVRLASGRIEGLECLTRFDASPSRPTEGWFMQAAEVGLSSRLEAATGACALHALPALPSNLYLSVNASPETVVDGSILRVLERVNPSRLVLEITEHRPIGDYRRMSEALDALRSQGLRLAVDDLGAGHADLRHLIHLRPDIIKLDISLTRSLPNCATTRALTASLVGFAHAIGSHVVAEGIETMAEFKAMKALSVDAGQGYLLGAPIKVSHPV